MARNYLAALLGLLIAQPALAADGQAANSVPSAAASPSIALMGAGLRVGNLDASLKFYEEGLGLVPVTTVPLGELEEIILSFDGRRMPPFLFLIGPKDRSANAPSDAARRQAC